jgi:hypothetical protein
MNRNLLAITGLTCGIVVQAAALAGGIDCGGSRATNAAASYCNDGSIGGIGGISSAGIATARNGYIGQLTEATSLSLTGTPAAVNETATAQLTGAATMDDDTVTTLAGDEITWNTPAWPIQIITAGGVATTAVVYANLPGNFSGSYLGVPSSGTLLVLDTIPDNYGSYAGDGLPDSWQNQYFGLDNPNAAPSADVTGTGQNNLFKYVAGLDPTNAASRFILRIAPVSGQPGQKNLIFNPRWNDRTYTPLFRTNLLAGTWQPLVNTNISDNEAERTITDLDATQPTKFYRIQINYQ